jgi:hypothetical protein
MTSQPWGNIIAGAGRASLSAESLKYLGLPRAEQPTPAGAFIGIVGGKPQSGIVAQGEGQQKISLGSNVLHSMSRFVLEEATVDGSGKSLLAIAR